MIADDVHIVYKVMAGSGGKGTAASALSRLVRRQERPTLREVHAVRGVSITAYKGDAIGLIGRNGSGKSTLLKAIAGLLPPASGSVYTSGRPSLLGVNAALMQDLTGDRNVVLGCLAMGMTPEEIEQKYDEIVDFAGVDEFIDLPMRTYSSGMAARLRFAIGSARTHDILLIDEALATGDADFRAQVGEEDQGPARRGRHRVPGQPQPGRRHRHLQPRHLDRQGHPQDGRRGQGSRRRLPHRVHPQEVKPFIGPL